MPVSDQLRAAIQKSELTLYRIAKDSGVPYGMLYRFAIGERDIRLGTADKLAAYFQMRLTRPIKPKRSGR
jgi:transcriptional regulator with XRE-family HTH domain